VFFRNIVVQKLLGRLYSVSCHKIEDGDCEVMLVARALADFPHRIHVARDGEEALAILEDGDGFNPPLRPDLILLDLGLPKLNGFDVLRLIKNDEA